MVEMKSAPNYSVPALEKGLAVLELLARAAEPLSLSQISERMANSTSQLFRTMNCLVESGYVIKDEIHGKYSLTLKLFELANRHSPLKHLLCVANLPMQELARTIRESCHISIVQHGQLLVVGQAESPEKCKSLYQLARPFLWCPPFPVGCCLRQWMSIVLAPFWMTTRTFGECRLMNVSFSGNASEKSAEQAYPPLLTSLSSVCTIRPY